MRSFVAVVVALCLPGCSLWNAPDPGLLDGGDAGFDASVPDAPPDAPLDVPQDSPDAPVIPEHETICDDGMDDDLDGAVDCVDTDCASDILECCREGSPTPLFTTTWCERAAPEVTTDWVAVAGSTSTSGTSPTCTIGSAGVGPNARVHRTCLPLAGGITISAVIDWGMTPCESCEAMLALTPVDDAAPGGLIEDVAVRVHEVSGRLVLDLTRAGEVLGRFPEGAMTLPDRFTVTLDLYPSVVDGRPTLAARASVVDGAVVGSIVAEETVAFPDDLLGAAQGCGVAPGLFLGLQTRGDPRFGRISVIPAQCPNPNYFRPAGTSGVRWLDAEAFGFEAILPEHEWTAGGIGGASVLALDDGGSTYWYYFFDGSNLNRANDRDRDLDFSFGGALALAPGLDTFTLWGDTAGAPMAGHDAPTCVPPGGSCGTLDYREPVVVPGTPAGVAFWVERLDGGATRIVSALGRFEPGAPPLGAPAVLDLAGCASPAHPAVLSRGTSHVLVYACGPLVQAVRLSPSLSPMGEPVTLVSAEDLGFPLGLVDVDGTISVSGEVATYRLWVAGRDALGLTRVAIAEGGVTITGDTEDGWPTLRPFAGNPVFSADEPLLQNECDGVCTITGVGVARPPGSRVVRVVLSVTDEDDGAVRHGLVPLEQTLR